MCVSINTYVCVYTYIRLYGCIHTHRYARMWNYCRKGCTRAPGKADVLEGMEKLTYNMCAIGYYVRAKQEARPQSHYDSPRIGAFVLLHLLWYLHRHCLWFCRGNCIGVCIWVGLFLFRLVVAFVVFVGGFAMPVVFASLLGAPLALVLRVCICAGRCICIRDCICSGICIVALQCCLRQC